MIQEDVTSSKDGPGLLYIPFLRQDRPSFAVCLMFPRIAASFKARTSSARLYRHGSENRRKVRTTRLRTCKALVTRHVASSLSCSLALLLNLLSRWFGEFRFAGVFLPLMFICPITLEPGEQAPAKAPPQPPQVAPTVMKACYRCQAAKPKSDPVFSLVCQYEPGEECE